MEMPTVVDDSKIEINQTSKPHQHTHNCKHHQQGRSQIFRNPFAMVPKSMYVFVVHSIVAGDLVFGMFMQLPMMGQFYQVIMMLKESLLYPIYITSNYFNSKFDGTNPFKKMITGLAVVYAIVHGLIFYYLKDTLIEKDLLITIQILLLISYILTIIIQPGYFTKEEFQDMLKSKPELMIINKRNRNICLLCDIPKVARSSHCIYCKRCVKRYETHSMMLNTCIGVYNYPFYLTFVSLCALYCCVFLREIYHRIVHHYYLCALDILLCLTVSIVYYQSTTHLYQQISYNITYMEIHQWRRYSYMWENIKGQFRNPFDQGIINNWVSFIKPLLTTSGVDNWGTLKILNAADIPNHPLSEIVSEQIEQQIQQLRQQERQATRNDVTDEKQSLLGQ